MDNNNSSFKKKSLLKLRAMKAQELDKYYREFRQFEFEKGKHLKGINIRKNIHPLLLQLLILDRKIKRENIIILDDKRLPRDNKPVIFAATHIGGNDTDRVFEAIKDHAYLMIGDPGIIYVNMIGLVLRLNGYLPVDTRNKCDRQIAYSRSIELLKNGGNLLIFPEGAYNVFENLPVMKLFPGAVKMSRETGYDIIPLAIEQYGENFYIKIGENIKPNYNLTVDEENENLRDILASLKWDIWEKQGITSRKSFSNDYCRQFRQSIVDRDDFGDYVYTLQDIYETMYHDKNMISEDKVFEVLDNIEMTSSNARVLVKCKNKY